MSLWKVVDTVCGEEERKFFRCSEMGGDRFMVSNENTNPHKSKDHINIGVRHWRLLLIHHCYLIVPTALVYDITRLHEKMRSGSESKGNGGEQTKRRRES
jgi:hypothetical protein